MVSTSITIRVEGRLKSRFKSVCAHRGKTMTEVLIEFIRSEVGEKREDGDKTSIPSALGWSRG